MDNLKYIQISAKNVIGIVNRISNLMRKRRYNMEEVSVSFNKDGFANILVAIDTDNLDLEQVISQLNKLQDVYCVNEISFDKREIYNVFYVYAKDKTTLAELDEVPVKIVFKKNFWVGFYILDLEESADFEKHLQAKDLNYMRKVMDLV